MRILVTGVTGAVGRLVARQLVAAGHAVSGIAPHPHHCLDPDVDFVCAPLGGPVLQRLADEADVVIHLASVETDAPGRAGINGVVQVTNAAARAGARLLFVSQAAGQPELYRPAETLVSTGWAPSLVIRMALPVGRQLDWMVCRTVATLLRSKGVSTPLRLVHLDDLVRFLLLAVASNRTGVVDLASPDTTHLVTARRLLQSIDQRPRLRRVRSWSQLAPEMDIAALQEDWQFEFGWRATEAVADTARGLIGRRLDVAGATDLPGHLALPLEPMPRSEPSDGMPLRCAAPDGLEGEFDDRIDPRFPVFSAATVRQALPGPLTPMTLDVQLAGLRTASRVMSQVMALGSVVAAEWGSRAIAVFGHRLYVGVSSNVVAAGQLPGWDEHAVSQQAVGGESQVGNLLPLGRPPLAHGLLGSATKTVVIARALGTLRHLKADTRGYCAAAMAEHLDAAQLTSLSDAGLEVRIRLLRDRVHQGWSLTALWVIDNGATPAALDRTGANTTVSGVGALLESERVAAETAALAAVLRHDRRVSPLAADGDLDGIRALFPGVAAAVDTAVARIAHRGPGEVELANATFGDDPAMLLIAAAQTPSGPLPPTGSAATLAERMTANARISRELAYDATMRFTHELRISLRELGSRRASVELIDIAEDVYYLTCDELLNMPADARLRVKRRRAERERLQALRLPDVIDHAWRPLGRTPGGE